MFNRPELSYTISDDVIKNIVKDVAQPLCQIAKLLPEGATVLDIGSGSGTLGRVVKTLGKNVYIDGIEPNEYASGLAGPYYRSVYTGFAQEYYSMIKENKYDYIVLADVLEHMPNPHDFLVALFKNLSNSTKLIISVPNIAFGALRLALMNGLFDYVDSGLLENTHLRFFTLKNARHLFKSSNLYVERILYLERSFYRVEFKRNDIRALPLRVLLLACNSEARAYQYLFVLNQNKQLETITEHHGTSISRILIDAIFARAWIKKILIKIIRL